MFQFDPPSLQLLNIETLKQLPCVWLLQSIGSALGAVGCLLTFLQPTSACCHGGQYVSVNNLAWRSLSALTLKLY